MSSDVAYSQYSPEPGFAAAVAISPFCDYFTPPPSAPALILTGSLDDWTPAKACESWVQRQSDHEPAPEIVVLEGAHHSFDLPGVRRQQFQGHTVASDRETYLQAREHQRPFFVEHLVER